LSKGCRQELQHRLQNKLSGLLAPLLIHLFGMTRLFADGRPERLLRWIFERDDQRVTCRVDHQPRNGFTLSLVPHSPSAIGMVETFTSAWSAFRRHAIIVSELRRSGWTLAAYTAD
jgi:hypothetical protein